MIRGGIVIAVWLVGCGSGDAPAVEAKSDAGADTAVGKRDVDAVLADYIAAWNEPDKAKRDAQLAASVTPDLVFIDPNISTNSSSALSDEIAAYLAKTATPKLFLTSGADHHHDRLRFHWRLTSAGALVVDGVDHVVIASDGRFARIVSYFDPVPAAPATLDATLAAFRDAFSTTDSVRRLELLRGALAGVYIDSADGVVDAAGLSAKIGALLAATPSATLTVGGLAEHSGGFRMPYTLAGKQGVFFGARAPGSGIAEITSYDGDVPRP